MPIRAKNEPVLQATPHQRSGWCEARLFFLDQTFNLVRAHLMHNIAGSTLCSPMLRGPVYFAPWTPK